MTADKIIAEIHKNNLEREILKYLSYWFSEYLDLKEAENDHFKATLRAVNRIASTNSDAINALEGITALTEKE